MGLFDIFKKKKPEQVKREETDDFNPLDMNSVIAWYKNQNPTASEKDVLRFVSKLAEHEEDLSLIHI